MAMGIALARCLGATLSLRDMYPVGSVFSMLLPATITDEPATVTDDLDAARTHLDPPESDQPRIRQQLNTICTDIAANFSRARKSNAE